MERLTNGIDYCKMHCDFGKSNECFFSDKDKCYERSIYNSLREYENLEERIGVPLEELANLFDKHIPKGCQNPNKAIVLTDEDVERWNEYKSEEKQGLLLRLPCGIGTDIYFVPSKTNFKLNILQSYPESNRVYHQTVERITFTKNGWYLECGADLEFATGHIMVDTSYKETWFVTQAEAEQKLKEMEAKLRFSI